MKTTSNILLIVCGIALAWALLEYKACSGVRVPDYPAPVVMQTKYDTVERVVVREKTIYKNVAAKVVYVTKRDKGSHITSATDTAICPAYVAMLDTTTMQGDTIGVEFAYPQMMFTVRYRPLPDTHKTVIKTETILISKPEPPRPWYVDLLSHIGAGVLGFYIHKETAK